LRITYIKDGVAGALLFMVCFCVPQIQKILDAKILRWLGKISFYLFCVHPLVENVCLYFLIDLLSGYMKYNTAVAIGALAGIVLNILFGSVLCKISVQWLPGLYQRQVAYLVSHVPLLAK